MENPKAFKVSAFSIVPVFFFLALTYWFFGFNLPESIVAWVYWSGVTVVIGMMTTWFIKEEVDIEWGLIAGASRWIFVAVAFSIKGILEFLGFGNPIVGSFDRIITLQFVFELPAMILGYVVGVKIFEEIEKRR